ncbi:MAG: FeoB-associated Cys-rich membrane protein [Prevotella sp.]|nr:FeoB-associated Cys-rich membrane protein [Prevotella sp.]
MQLFIVIIVLLACIGYALWRLLSALTPTKDPCEGCSGCTLKSQINKNMACSKKK